MATRHASVRPDYLRLVQRFPLVPIRNKSQLKQALAMVDELSIIDEEKLTAGQADYLLVLSDLVESYEEEHSAFQNAFKDGIDALRYLMAETGITASQLGEILGNRRLDPAVLRRERELSKAHIVKLAGHFSVSTDLFLMPTPKTVRKAS
jgi:HTH-type transcriptional regulator/antitoxin HigA